MFDFNLWKQRKSMKCHNSRLQLSSDTKEKEQRNEKPQNSDMQVDGDQQSNQLLFPYSGDYNTVYSKANINAIMESYDSRKGYDLAMPETLPSNGQ